MSKDLVPTEKFNTVVEYFLDPIDPESFAVALSEKISTRESFVKKMEESKQPVLDALSCVVENPEEKVEAEKMLGVLKYHKDAIEDETEPLRSFLDKLKKNVLEERRRHVYHIVDADQQLRSTINEFTRIDLLRVQKENRLTIEKAERERKARQVELQKQLEKARAKGKESKVQQIEEKIQDVQTAYIPNLTPEPKTRKEIHIQDLAKFLASVSSIRNEVFDISKAIIDKLYEKGYSQEEVLKFRVMLDDLRKVTHGIIMPMHCIEFDCRLFDTVVQGMNVGVYEWGSVENVPLSARARSK